MEIIIYEDNLEDQELLSKFIKAFFYKKDVKYNIHLCKNSKDLLKNISSYDLCFLDMELDYETKNGIDIGLEIRCVCADIRIIIVSNYKKYLIDGYKVQADRYFIKPLNQNEFNIELEIILKNYLENYLGIFDIKISKEKIYFNDILYIEFFDRKTVLNLTNGKKIPTSYALKEWAVLVENLSFSQPHKSFLVNLKHVTTFDNTIIIMINNDHIPLSRHYKKKFVEKYLLALHKW